MRRVVRIGRRRSAWEQDDPRAIAEVEFRDPRRDALDLRPSVYEVHEHQEAALRRRVVQVCAEHWVSFIRPPRPPERLAFDVAGCTQAPLVPSPGTTAFAFSNEAHGELVFASENELLAMMATLRAELAVRDLRVTLEEVLAHVDTRLTAFDPEWVLAHETNVRGWPKELAKFRTKRGPGQA